MHFFLLGLGILVGLYGLYRFILNANVKQITALFMVGGFMAVCIALFYLAVTGRLPAAIGIFAAMSPFLLTFMRKKKVEESEHHSTSIETMTKDEAFEILGISNDAEPNEIKEAYNKLMKKVHPDQEGSKWMAAKLNQAKDILLD